MSATTQPPARDPRVLRSRAHARQAARTLFLSQGYASTTMDQIAAEAGLSKRTLYNVFETKEALFSEIVSEVIAFAEKFAERMSEELEGLDVANAAVALRDLAVKLALGVLRPEVIALRRLLIREAEAFPAIAEDYFERAPGRVMCALSDCFEKLGQCQVLRIDRPRRVAEHFAYLVAGAPLDRAVLTGRLASEAEVKACAEDGVDTFLARYGTGPSIPPLRVSTTHPPTP